MGANKGSERKQHGRLRPSEIALTIIAGLMLLGWAFRWMGYGGPPEAPSDTAPAVFPWFATFSVPSAVLVLALIFLKLNCIELLPGKGQEKILPYISLLPVLGFLIAELSSVQTFLTVGGAMALAYISATSYWRNYIPDFITNPLGADAADSRAAPPKGEPKKTPLPPAVSLPKEEPAPGAGSTEKSGEAKKEAESGTPDDAR